MSSSYLALRARECWMAQRLVKEISQRGQHASRQDILRYQLDSLRQFIHHAKSHSPWYAQRLQHINPNTMQLSDLSSIPPMTKQDVMANWDQIVTDRSLRLQQANEFITGLTHASQPSYFQDRYRVHATGGSSGTRGVFPWSVEAVAEFAAVFGRFQYFHDQRAFATSSHQLPITLAVVASDHPIHLSSPLFTIPLRPFDRVFSPPATLHVEELIATLNQHQPTHISGFTTSVQRIAEQAERGRLNFVPKHVTVHSEPLSPELRRLFRRVWPAHSTKLINMWGSTDCGPHAQGCGESDDLHLNEDAVIVEALDHEGRPSLPGQLSHSLYLTNLINPLLPLIRYALDDRIMLSPHSCPCGSSLQLIHDVAGRIDDDFQFRDVLIDTHHYNTIMYIHPSIQEYQIFQTLNGVRIIFSGDPSKPSASPLATVIAQVKEMMHNHGVPNADVQAEVGRVQRHPQTGKLRRFVPLTRPATKPS